MCTAGNAPESRNSASAIGKRFWRAGQKHKKTDAEKKQAERRATLNLVVRGLGRAFLCLSVSIYLCLASLPNMHPQKATNGEEEEAGAALSPRPSQRCHAWRGSRAHACCGSSCTAPAFGRSVKPARLAACCQKTALAPHPRRSSYVNLDRRRNASPGASRALRGGPGRLLRSATGPIVTSAASAQTARTR
eukprot:scaffold87907_cov60-Phaeocystis_antarctica.AAC.4